ncbi:MAG: hypothetical protein WBG30_02140 [Psychrilyobacter sp.]|uniref:hypothetical protein n=1 Tax=Psychrilyobacter sp. TaxID=2586924 RepID=UPI003C73547D
MKKNKLIFILLLGLMLIGCSNVEERINNKAISEVDRGNYIKASYLLNDAIKINPNYLDGMVNYRNVYPQALTQAVEKIGEYQKVSDYKLEAYAYEDLLKLKNNYYYADDLVHQKLGLSLEIPTIEELYKLKGTMGKVYYSAGNELEERKLNREEKREKYFLYERGVELSPKYKDIVDHREKAYQKALVKAMIKFSKNTPTIYKNNLESQVKANIAKGKKRTLIRLVPLDDKKFVYAWKNNKADNIINTGIKIDLNYITRTPESIKKSVTPLTWSEQYVVNTKNGPVVKNIRKTYFKHDFYKSANVKVSFTYIMKDTSTGEIIGSGTFDGIGEDNYKWSTFSGNIPKAQSGKNYVRKLKSKKELTEIALRDVVLKMSLDISDKI